jgi:flagellar biogenesis protein FliO
LAVTQETVRTLSDAELSQVITWAQDEIKTRTERRKQEAIAKIKALASQVGVSVSIAGVRGRPARLKQGAKTTKAE